MNALLSIGTCFLMHGAMYRVDVDFKDGIYLLEQRVVVFEEKRTFYEYWKQPYIDSVAIRTKCNGFEDKH